MVELLDYHSPQKRTSRRGTAAILLAVPGAFAWTLFFLAITGRLPEIRASTFDDIFGMCLFAATVSAIISSIAYIRFRRPMHWTVVVNLIINIPGLLFVLVVLVGSL